MTEQDEARSVDGRSMTDRVTSETRHRKNVMTGGRSSLGGPSARRVGGSREKDWRKTPHDDFREIVCDKDALVRPLLQEQRDEPPGMDPGSLPRKGGDKRWQITRERKLLRTSRRRHRGDPEAPRERAAAGRGGHVHGRADRRRAPAARRPARGREHGSGHDHGKGRGRDGPAPALRAFMSAIVQCVRTAFGNQADVLADFGLAPKKVRGSSDGRAEGRSGREARGNSRSAGHEEREGQEGDQGCRDGHRGDPRRGRSARRAGARRPHREPQHGDGDGRDGAAHRLASGGYNKGKGRRLRKGGGPPVPWDHGEHCAPAVGSVGRDPVKVSTGDRAKRERRWTSSLCAHLEILAQIKVAVPRRSRVPPLCSPGSASLRAGLRLRSFRTSRGANPGRRAERFFEGDGAYRTWREGNRSLGFPHRPIVLGCVNDAFGAVACGDGAPRPRGRVASLTHPARDGPGAVRLRTDAGARGGSSCSRCIRR